MIDTAAITCHEDPTALDDYQAHREEIERDRVAAIVTDALARSFFADLTPEGGNPDGAQILAGVGYDLTRQHALALLADTRLVITLADAS